MEHLDEIEKLMSKETGDLGSRFRSLLSKFKKVVDQLDDDLRAQRKGYIPYSMTVNADPLHNTGILGYFEQLSTASQKMQYDNVFAAIMHKHRCIKELEVHYEGEKSKLHCHVIMYITFGDTWEPIQKSIHEALGRRGKKKDICCTIHKIRTDDDFAKVKEYVNKENMFPCATFIRNDKKELNLKLFKE